MLIIESNNIKKYFGDRLILDIDKLNIYSEDRIGIVGINGAGKTTLINILSKRIEPDEGWVRLNAKTEYISQLEEPDTYNIGNEIASKFGIEVGDNMLLTHPIITFFVLLGTWLFLNVASRYSLSFVVMIVKAIPSVIKGIPNLKKI